MSIISTSPAPADGGADGSTTVQIDSATLQDLRGKADAVDRAQAIIEFGLDGTVLTANANFLGLLGYTAPEIEGQHHRIFCEPDLVASQAYADFWDRLRAGEYEAGEYKRLGKNGKEVWIQATYNPVLDADGNPYKIVKFASDVTATKLRNAEVTSRMDAVDRSQGVIEFDLDGRVLTANANFLGLLGYSLPEVAGKHHRMFCDADLVASVAYQEFWDHLRAGEYETGEYKRLGKNGKEVWIQATYNPILDADGNPYKIVKFASDVTAAKIHNAEISGKMEAVDRAQAIIEFGLDGTVLTANPIFLDLLGYSLPDVAGKHHRIFCEPDLVASQAYADFWDRLRAGQYEAGEYKRLGKNGKEVWIQATYNPILDADGNPYKIIKFASDVTATKLATAEVAGRMDAVDRSQGIIEFDLDGMVLHANDNFLRALGYSLREVVGRHHSDFCTREYTRSEEYRDFWLRLGHGELISGKFHRIGKFERDVHIQATYNPILDLSGTPYKVVKYAYDVTAEVTREQRIAADTDAMTQLVQSLTTSIHEIAKSSSSATDLAGETQTNAGDGLTALRASLEAIDLIEKSSHSISEIVRVMGEIANQTNLLAFNASIEAARAGEHGVGFSIVAGEVRKLAERSSEAASQIGALIEESVVRVEQGSTVSRRAEGAFERIADSVQRTSDAIATISTFTQEQQEFSAAVGVLIRQLSTTDA